MARTYHSEGRQVAYLFRGIFVLIALSLFYFIPDLHLGVFFGLLIAGLITAEILGAMWTRKRRAQKSARKSAQGARKVQSRRTSMECRPDEMILTSSLDELSGAEFERLLALYFRDQGYVVKEVGVGGNDGGVDLVIIDKR